jgi:Spy/CpxP family protein refolding chaperone
MNKVRRLIFGGAVLAFSAVALVNVPMSKAQDSSRRGERPFARGDRMHGAFAGGAPLISIALKHKSELNLSGDQVSNLEKIRNHYQSQVTPLHQQLQVAEKEIASLMQQTPADLIQLKARIQDTEKLRSELRYQRIEALENGRSVLSAQQQDQLKTLVRSRHGQFHKPQGQPS